MKKASTHGANSDEEAPSATDHRPCSQGGERRKMGVVNVRKERKVLNRTILRGDRQILRNLQKKKSNCRLEEA